ncbi:MAG: DUF2608 domain-containing protein [Chlamydiae bacterium]|nr:DUF2608 domain-containing protein [Chlamydiota bacterium]
MGICFPLFGEAPIIESFDEIQKPIADLDQNALVVLDVDDVLIYYPDQIMSIDSQSVRDRVISEELKKYPSYAKKKEIIDRLSKAVVLAKRQLVENQIPILISEIQKKGVKVIALTNLRKDSYGGIHDLELWRIEDLKSLNLDFSQSFPKKDRIVLNKLGKFNKDGPVFHKGILFSAEYTKGEVLSAFLEEVSFKPSKIIFIDDLEYNLESVEKEMRQKGIPFQGYLFRNPILRMREADENIARLQARHLIDEEKWISDSEAKRLLSN